MKRHVRPPSGHYKLKAGDPAAETPQLPRVELLVGLLTVPAAAPIRSRRRESWLAKARYDCPSLLEYRFVLSIREPFDGRLLLEATEHKDMLFVDAPAGFDFISHKVKYFVDWAVDNFRFKYLLKADDDSSVCLSGLCAELDRIKPGVPLYMGKFKYRNVVNLDPSQRQYNPRYLNETGHSTYLPYAGGAGQCTALARR